MVGFSWFFMEKIPKKSPFKQITDVRTWMGSPGPGWQEFQKKTRTNDIFKATRNPDYNKPLICYDCILGGEG